MKNKILFLLVMLSIYLNFTMAYASVALPEKHRMIEVKIESAVRVVDERVFTVRVRENVPAKFVIQRKGEILKRRYDIIARYPSIEEIRGGIAELQEPIVLNVIESDSLDGINWRPKGNQSLHLASGGQGMLSKNVSGIIEMQHVTARYISHEEHEQTALIVPTQVETDTGSCHVDTARGIYSNIPSTDKCCILLVCRMGTQVWFCSGCAMCDGRVACPSCE